MEKENRHLHEIVRPVRELSRAAMEWVVDRVIPSDSVNALIQGESAQRTVDMFAMEQPEEIPDNITLADE